MTATHRNTSYFRHLTLFGGALSCLLALWLNLPARDTPAADPQFKAGAFVQDVTPPFESLLINGGFLERRRGKMTPGDLKARCFVLERGEVTLAIAVVDSCMIPREVCDQAKALASNATGIPPERILITATHTHSAPSTMDYCLGTMADPAYTKFLPSKIAEGIAKAHQKLEPAQIGWEQVKAPGYTNCRRWITRPDEMLTDPFGEKSVRAMMHPGYRNPKYIGPSGPVDDELSLLSIQSLDGSPLAVLANFSMHYHGGGGGPADYFGLYSDRLAEQLAVDGKSPVCAMTQGTSGDLYRVDYSKESKADNDISRYTNELVELSKKALNRTTYHQAPPLAMDQEILTLQRRLPDEKRLAWADNLLTPMKGRRPKNRPEVYAEQARFIDANPTEKVVLQTMRIGDLAITAAPNEVYAITGLKIKARSPFSSTFNIELANGAAGYIPPPEQHALGGYTTWPARTAGLEIEAEPKIVEAVLASLEKLAGKPRKPLTVHKSTYAKTILADKPLAYWQCEEFDGSELSDISGNDLKGFIEGMVAYHLPGPAKEAFSGDSVNSSLQLVGGTISASVPEARSLSFWFWNGMITSARNNTGDLVQNGDSLRLRIGGIADLEAAGTLMIENGEQVFQGSTKLALHTWHHVVAASDGKTLNLYLDGNPKAEISSALPGKPSREWRFGGSLPFEGRLDEISWFGETLTGEDAKRHFVAAGMTPPSTPASPQDESERGPLSSKDALGSIQVPEGYQVELVAAEPLVQDPVAIDWAPDGKLWVAEMADYPSGIDGKPGGRVRFLEDLDGDGTYDKSTLFLDELNFPAGIMSWREGVLIAAAPDIIYAEDTDDDGRADIREVLFTGFKQGNQQLRVNGLHWGLDNWIHGANGSHHSRYASGVKINSTRAKKSVELGSLDFRIRPDEGSLEPLSGPSQFGRTRDDWGNAFGVQNSFPLWHYVLEHRYLSRNPDFAAPDPRRQLRPRNPRVFQATSPQKRFHSFNNSGRFTSACSPMIYRDDFFFDDNKIHAFTCEPFHNLVQHMILTPDACSFSAKRAEGDQALDFFASKDRWSRPVMARTGPDGALWVVDMYRYMIEHPEWLPEAGKTEMKPHERLGSQQGRIYRVVPKKPSPKRIPNPGQATLEQLVLHLGNTNGVIRDLAHRLLVERKAVVVTDSLAEMARNHDSAKARLHALCVLDGIDRLSPKLLESALHDPHPQIRRHALRLSESRWESQPNLLTKALILTSDQNAAVRLQAACSLGLSESPPAGHALARLAVENQSDPFIQAAVFSSAHLHFDHLAEAALENDGLIQELIKLGGKQSSLDALISRLATPDKGIFTPTQLRGLATWLDHKPTASSRLGDVIQSARKIIVDDNAPVALRTAAAGLLGRQEDHLVNDRNLLTKFLSPQFSTPLKLAAIKALAREKSDELPGILLQGWSGYLPNERTQILDTLLQRSNWTKACLEALAKEKIAHRDLDASRRQLLLTHSDPAIRRTATRVLKTGPSQERLKQIEPFRDALKLKGNREKGGQVFQALCAVCHLPAEGLSMNGPDLRSITDRTREGLFSSILNPNQSVDPSYASYTVTLRDGSTLFGRVLSENASHLTLRQLDGTDHQLSRKSIKALKNTGRSLMPDGLEAAMTYQDLADLIRFLQGFGQAE